MEKREAIREKGRKDIKTTGQRERRVIKEVRNKGKEESKDGNRKETDEMEQKNYKGR